MTLDEAIAAMRVAAKVRGYERIDPVSARYGWRRFLFFGPRAIHVWTNADQIDGNVWASFDEATGDMLNFGIASRRSPPKLPAARISHVATVEATSATEAASLVAFFHARAASSPQTWLARPSQRRMEAGEETQVWQGVVDGIAYEVVADAPSIRSGPDRGPDDNDWSLEVRLPATLDDVAKLRALASLKFPTLAEAYFEHRAAVAEFAIVDQRNLRVLYTGEFAHCRAALQFLATVTDAADSPHFAITQRRR